MKLSHCEGKRANVMINSAKPGMQAIPPLFAKWLEELLAVPRIPSETRATCDSCAMCAPLSATDDEPRAADKEYFSPSTKCCTFYPVLANFQAGRLFSDSDPGLAAAREIVVRRIDACDGVTPLGIQQPPGYAELPEHRDGFGRSEALLCPFFRLEDGRCGIWRHREAVCTSFYCKHERGGVGQAFWGRLRELLLTIEHTVARHCVLESGLAASQITATFPTGLGFESPSKEPPRHDPRARRRIWGVWLGREREYYEWCGATATALSADDICRIGGVHIPLRTALVREAWDQLERTELPDRLAWRGRVSPVASTGDGRVRLATYSPMDEIDLPAVLVAALRSFDGRRVAAVTDEIASESGMRMSEGLLRRLVELEVLEAVDDEDACPPTEHPIDSSASWGNTNASDASASVVAKGDQLDDVRGGA